MRGVLNISLYQIVISFLVVISSACSDVQENKYHCFESVYDHLTNDTIKEIDFGLQLNCFDWDSLELGLRGSYKNYPSVNFTIIEGWERGEKRNVMKGSSIESKMDWFDMDRHWQMIYFYKGGNILNYALAISQSAVSFTELMIKQKVRFISKSESKFRISDMVRGPIQNLIKHRQVFQKSPK